LYIYTAVELLLYVYCDKINYAMAIVYTYLEVLLTSTTNYILTNNYVDKNLRPANNKSKIGLEYKQP